MLTDRPTDKLETYAFAKKHGVLVVDVDTNAVNAIYHPDCIPSAIIELRRYWGIPIRLQEVDKEHFVTMLTQVYETKAIASQQLAEDIGENLDLHHIVQHLPNASDLLESEANAPVIRLINALMREAVNQFASDIHFETFEKTLNVRFRTDGILRNVLEVPFLLAPLVISRLKVMAKLDISEKRLPQDGRITVKVADRTVDVRMSIIPVSHGERIVLRILDKKNTHLNLADLGIDPELLPIVRRMISKPHGVILVTGPTGSGKTTTLYAILTELNVPGRNIMTVEDPVEYDLSGIAQIQVNPKIEMDFARSLRAILRQDPNVVMIGEIRDVETAIIAIQASLTGHLVFTTLHTNTAVGAITRLRDIGVESFLLSASLLGVIAQRLVRLLCNNCKEPYILNEPEYTLVGAKGIDQVAFKAIGCKECNSTGYKGRIGIYEVMEMDSTLRTLIHENASEQNIETYVRRIYPSIWQDGCKRVLSGHTSLEEIIRVTTE